MGSGWEPAYFRISTNLFKSYHLVAFVATKYLIITPGDRGRGVDFVTASGTPKAKPAPSEEPGLEPPDSIDADPVGHRLQEDLFQSLVESADYTDGHTTPGPEWRGAPTGDTGGDPQSVLGTMERPLPFPRAGRRLRQGVPGSPGSRDVRHPRRHEVDPVRPGDGRRGRGRGPVLPRTGPHARESRRPDERHHDAHALQPRPRSRGNEAVPGDPAEGHRSVPRVCAAPWTSDPSGGDPRGLRTRTGVQPRVPDARAREVRRAFPAGLRGRVVPVSRWKGPSRGAAADRRRRAAHEARHLGRMDSDPDEEGRLRLFAERHGPQQLELQRVRGDGRGHIPREASE